MQLHDTLADRLRRELPPAAARRLADALRSGSAINFAETKSDIAPLLTPGLKTIFFDTFGQTAAYWDKIATVVPSEKDTENYGWLGAIPGVREFIDERQPGEMATYSYAIKNKTWESSIAVDRAALEDDLYGEIAMKVRQMAQTSKQHLDILIFGLLTGGFTSTCYDGANFFGVHTQGGIAQNNKNAESLSAMAVQDGITAMMRFVDDKGRPMGIVPDLLVVPPELTWEGQTLLNSAFFPDAVEGAQQLAMNPLRGMLSLVTSPYLTNTTNWFLLDTKRVVRAIVLQMRKDFEFDALEQDTETGFLRDQFLYGVRARYNVGYGDWRAAFAGQVS